MERTSFVFHKEWRFATMNLPTDIRAEIYDAIIEYGLSGTIPAGMKPMASVAFSFIKNDIDKDLAKYTAICERNRANGSRSKGRPKTQSNPKKPKKPTGLFAASKHNEKPIEYPLPKGVSEEKPSGFSGLSKGEKGLTKETKEILSPTPPFQEKKENNTYISARTHVEISFEEFWNAYGYKKSKTQAERAWNRLSSADKTNAFSSIPDYKRDCQACGRSMKYPATYLNGRTWEDDFSSNNNSYATTRTNQRQQESPTNDELRQQTVEFLANREAQRRTREGEIWR